MSLQEATLVLWAVLVIWVLLLFAIRNVSFRVRCISFEITFNVSPKDIYYY
jgi:hypothetical protein